MAKFVDFEEESGFDECAQPRPWLMVPLGGTNLVRLSDGHGAKIKIPSKGVELEDERDLGLDRHLEFRGRAVGAYTISAELPNGESLQLDIAVKKQQTKTISFYFVKVKGKPDWSTERNSDDVQKLIEALNDIFEWQANTKFAPAEMVFELPPFKAHKAAAEVGFAGQPDYQPLKEWGTPPECETTPSAGKHVAEKKKFEQDPAWSPSVIFDAVPSVGDFRVFFVKRLKNLNTKLGDTDGISSSDGYNIMCEDALGPGATGVTRDKVLYKVIAHEIAHTLREDPGHVHYQNNKMLLFRETAGGMKLSKDDIVKINKS